MKINKAKFVVASLVICSTFAMVGSISSTVAWYQYSTRVSAVYLGTSAGAEGNLKLRIKGTNTWLSDLTYKDIADYLESVNKGQKVTPITSGPMTGDSAIATDDNGYVFYKNPKENLVERVDYSDWLLADDSMYVSIPFELAYVVKEGEDTSYLSKDVYISDLLIQEDWKNKQDTNNKKEDLSNAIRVHISSYQSNDQANTTFNRLISKNGGTILTEGYLDLDGDGNLDEYLTGATGANYGFGNEENINRHYIAYGNGLQNSYSNKYKTQDGSYQNLKGEQVQEKVYPAVVESENNSTGLKEDSLEFVKEGETVPTSKKIGKTIAFEKKEDAAYLNVIMTIWVEGWEPLPSPTTDNPDAKSPIWNASDYIGSMFDVGIEFAVPSEQ